MLPNPWQLVWSDYDARHWGFTEGRANGIPSKIIKLIGNLQDDSSNLRFYVDNLKLTSDETTTNDYSRFQTFRNFSDFSPFFKLLGIAANIQGTGNCRK